jgi:single-stranded-DNA-specific exonuclease
VHEAVAMLEGADLTDVRVLVLAASGWNPGVVGIVAGKLAERFYRPAVVIGIDEERTRGKGSARSIPGFDLYHSIHACRHLLDTCGGHEMAAGLSLTMDRLDDFKASINEHAAGVLTPDDLVPKIRFDGDVDPSYFKHPQLHALEQFAPFGEGNPEPRFAARSLELCDVRRIGKDQSHLRLRVRGKGPMSVEAVAWGRAERFPNLCPGARLAVLYTPQMHHFNGRRSLQLNLRDLRLALGDDHETPSTAE